MKQLTPLEDEQLATTPTEELLALDLLQPRNIKDTLHAYQLAKHCNEKRVMAQELILFHPVLLSHLLRLMNLMAHVETFIKTCSQTVQQVVQVLPMKSQMLLSY